jgi:hypothetical protein
MVPHIVLQRRCDGDELGSALMSKARIRSARSTEHGVGPTV